jgi:hypothetical protein
MARGSVKTVDASVDLTALPHGLLSWHGVYASPADPLAVWRTFPRLSKMELGEGAHSRHPCLRLFQVERFYAVMRTTSVRLCPASSGTLIYLNERIYLWP